MVQNLERDVLEVVIMLRALVRLILLVVILVGVAAFLLGWFGNPRLHPGDNGAVTGTSGRVDTERAKEAGAKAGEKTAEFANRAQAALSDSALTAKIKSKMALDDMVRARSIDVTTDAGVVTLSGTVRSAAERERSIQLAKETTGVTRVVDHLKSESQ
jgi:hyperosmotically inducible protein